MLWGVCDTYSLHAKIDYDKLAQMPAAQNPTVRPYHTYFKLIISISLDIPAYFWYCCLELCHAKCPD